MNKRFFAYTLLAVMLLAALSACASVGAQTGAALGPVVQQASPTPVNQVPQTGSPGAQSLQTYQSQLETIYNNVNPSVVTITNETQGSTNPFGQGESQGQNNN